MVWGQTIPLFLLTILHGVCRGGLFDAKCVAEPRECGQTASFTCILTHPVHTLTLKHNDTHSLSHKLLEKEGRIKDEETTIAWTEDKVEVIFPKVRFSDNLKYVLILDAKKTKGNHVESIALKVSGLCEPEINNKTKELECVTESEENASIVWMDDHRTVYRATRTPASETLNNGYKLRSFLELTDEIGHNICCSVSYQKDGVWKEKKTCEPNTSRRKEIPSSMNPSLYVFFALLGVAFVAAAFGYLLKRRSKIIVGAGSRCEGQLISAEPNATEATTETV